MIIKKMLLGPLQANCYLIGCEDTKMAAAIDPGDEADIVLSALQESGLQLKYILNTHGHFDHTGGNGALKQATGAELLIHEEDAALLGKESRMGLQFGVQVEDSPPADKYFKDGDIIEVGNIRLQVLHTPGHSPGGVSFLTGKSLFSGDTLFSGSVGRADLPGGDMQTLINSIREKLFQLDNDIIVYPGHMGTTTIGREKESNPFVGNS